jgi:hypothetical protein
MNGGAAIAGRRLLPVACNGGDRTVGGNPADAVIAEIGNIKGSRGVDGEAVREIKLRLARRTRVATETGNSRPRHSCDHALGVDHAHAVMIGVCEEQIAARVEQYALNGAYLRRKSGAAITEVVAPGDSVDSIASLGRSLAGEQR